jgi:hypothetical protein
MVIVYHAEDHDEQVLGSIDAIAEVQRNGPQAGVVVGEREGWATCAGDKRHNRDNAGEGTAQSVVTIHG